MATGEWALEIQGLCKAFDKPAVDHLSLKIRKGELYALLGPNSAGKTTTLKMVTTGLLTPERGVIRVRGIDAIARPVEAKQIMPRLPDEPLIYDKLSPLEYLEFVAGLWGIDADRAEARAHDLLGLLGLRDQASARCQGLSKGMRQKVALAGALIHA